MGYYDRRDSSIFDSFTLSPLPYPVLLILSVIFVFFGTSWYFSYEAMVEEAEDQINWVLLATPILLVLAVRWLSTVENPEMLFGGFSPWDRRRRAHHRPTPPEGSSPWGVAAVIVLVLVMVQFRSVFLDGWLV